jgi:hypothetical protein
MIDFARFLRLVGRFGTRGLGLLALLEQTELLILPVTF